MFCSTAQLASTSVPTLAGLDRLAAATGGVGSVGQVDNAKKGHKFFKSLGFGSSKQEDVNDFTHMRYNCVTPLWAG